MKAGILGVIPYVCFVQEEMVVWASRSQSRLSVNKAPISDSKGPAESKAASTQPTAQAGKSKSARKKQRKKAKNAGVDAQPNTAESKTEVKSAVSEVKAQP